MNITTKTVWTSGSLRDCIDEELSRLGPGRYVVTDVDVSNDVITIVTISAVLLDPFVPAQPGERYLH